MIQGFINCNTTHLVYMLKCPCRLVHVIQTKINVKIHIAEDKVAIGNNNMDYALERHYKAMNLKKSLREVVIQLIC